MADFTVYGTSVSPFVRKVEGALHLAGAEYDLEEINIMAMPDWFLEISPARRIPVLRDKTVGTEGVAGTLPDSSAICLFLEKRLKVDLYGQDAFAAGRAAWFEEYADTVIAMTAGLDLFRPIIFPLFSGKPSDLETAKKAWNEKLPKLFDYLETSLEGQDYFVGGAYSVADLAIGAQMIQIDLVAGLPDARKWPALVKHTEAAKAQPGFAENIAKCEAMLGGILPEKVDLAS